MVGLIVICAVAFVSIGVAVYLMFSGDEGTSSSRENDLYRAEENQEPIAPEANKNGFDLQASNEFQQEMPSDSSVHLSLVEKVKMILFRTDEFFDNVPISESIAEPYLFCLKIGLSVFFVDVVFRFIGSQFGLSKQWVFAEFLFAIPFLFLSVFIGAALNHLFVMLFKGKGGFRGTFHVLAYASGTSVWGIIPVVGKLIGGIWAVIVCVKGYKKVHQMSTARAVMVYISILIIIPLIALSVAITFPNLLRAKISANDALAESTLRMLSTASETYATVNDGRYPAGESDLVNADPPYTNNSYCNKIISGYQYECEFSSNGYVLRAIPNQEKVSGTSSMEMRTGGLLEREE